MAGHLCQAVNYELHRRKTFWVDEALAWMLLETDLDVPGEIIRLPFAAFAVAFTDPPTLGLAESLLQQLPACDVRGQPLRILTAQVTRQGPVAPETTQELDIGLSFDAGRGDWPFLLVRTLRFGPEDRLDAILDSRICSQEEIEVDPTFHTPEMRKLVHLTLNALLYITSAQLEQVLLQSAPGRPGDAPGGKGASRGRAARRARRARRRRGAWSDEDVLFLPSKVPIGQVRRLRQLERGDGGRGLTRRFMVRGHWRKANPDWKDQRLRWIEPYWKGPELGQILERDYELRP
jgi:hypothetical protein